MNISVRCSIALYLTIEVFIFSTATLTFEEYASAFFKLSSAFIFAEIPVKITAGTTSVANGVTAVPNAAPAAPISPAAKAAPPADIALPIAATFPPKANNVRAPAAVPAAALENFDSYIFVNSNKSLKLEVVISNSFSSSMPVVSLN